MSTYTEQSDLAAALTLVHHSDDVRAWNGDHDIQMVARLQSDGEWYITAEQDGDVLVDCYGSDGSLFVWVAAIYGDALEFLAEDV
ncbi:hypothetical protein VPHK225_0056 [Vibrio phage K225]|nr:hypothetical protein PODOV044v1_p0002 [Vibrio phage 23E28.1]QZI92043.1 hypothetical protein PODOV045v1_p0001 [Vibrio phage 69E27.1]